MKNQIEFEGKFAEEYKNFKKEFKQSKPSILLLGGTGSGKSTLVNTIFKNDIALAGTGKPITKGIKKYENEYYIIYDSEGYETGAIKDHENYIRMIDDFIGNQLKNNCGIIVWFCLSAPSARVTDVDIELLKKCTSANIPTCTIITKVDISNDIQIDSVSNIILEYFKEMQIFESSIDENSTIKNKGPEAIYNWSINNLDDACKIAFICGANRKLDEKEKKGESIIIQQTSLVATACLSPLPASDAALIVPIQTAMLCRIFYLWGMLQAQALAGVIIESCMPILGRIVAGNLLKLIPGLGTAAGTAINATVASSLTFGLGVAINKACRYVVECQLNGKKIDILEIIDSKEFADQVLAMSKSYKK